MNWSEITSPRNLSLLIAGYDIRRSGHVRKKQNSQIIFKMLDELSLFASTLAEQAGGKMLKVLGDSALMVFPEKNSDAGINIMMDIQKKGGRMLSKYSALNLTIFCHVGEVTIGPMGPHRQLDIIGKAVNVLFSLEKDYPKQQVILSPEAFAKLKKESRQKFHKYTPPIVYLVK